MQSIGIYYRVSTDRQDLASQQKAVENWLEQLPANRRPKKSRVFKDVGISGKTAARPGYQNLLKAAYSHEIDTIVVYKLDRISRNATDAIQTLLALDQAGIAFISVSQAVLNLGHDNPFRRTMLAAFSEIAEIERETIVARVNSGIAAAKARGVSFGRPKKFSDEDCARVQELREQGNSMRRISELTGISLGSVQNLIKRKNI